MTKRRHPKTRAMIARLEETFGDMRPGTREEAQKWLASHPEAGVELFRMLRRYDVISLNERLGKWQGCNIAPDGWPL